MDEAIWMIASSRIHVLARYPLGAGIGARSLIKDSYGVRSEIWVRSLELTQRLEEVGLKNPGCVSWVTFFNPNQDLCWRGMAANKVTAAHTLGPSRQGTTWSRQGGNSAARFLSAVSSPKSHRVDMSVGPGLCAYRIALGHRSDVDRVLNRVSCLVRDATSKDVPSRGPAASSRPVPGRILVERVAVAPVPASAGRSRRGNSIAARRG
jgi:hypothetical protein